jgi:NTE family protein
MNNSTQAVVLSGGGAYGAYEVGVLKALVERGWAGPQVVTGVSAGAFNAALLASAYDVDLPRAVEHIEDIWLNRIPGRVFHVRADPRPLLGFQIRDYLASATRWVSDVQSLSTDFLRRLLALAPFGPFDERLLQLVDLSSFISVAPLERLMGEIILPEKLRRSTMKLSIIATNWSTGKAEVFTNESMSDEDAVSILLASAAIPGFFPPRKVGETTYVDGGLVMNTPLRPAIDDGADEIHIVYLDPDIAMMPLQKFQNTFDTLDRVLAVNLAFHINADIETARQMNRAIDLFAHASSGIQETKMSDLAKLAAHWDRVKSERPPRKLTIHRYHPQRDLGGLLGILRFEKSAIEELMEKGYQDTIRHDCEANDCERPVGRS